MDKPGGRGSGRGKGRGKKENQQQQQRPAQSVQPSQQPAPQLAAQTQAAPNPWNQKPEQQQQQPGKNAWNKAGSSSIVGPGPTVAAPIQAAQPQPGPAGSGGAGDQSGTDAIRKQMSQMSIGASGDAKGPSGKIFEKPEILKTRPDHVVNKKGNYGTVVKLDTNYFKFNAETNWSLYQYRVDFTPDEERTSVKRRLFNRIPQNLFVPNIFDGNVLTTIHYHVQPKEFTVTHTEDETKVVNIKIRFVAALQNKLDYGYFQLFNLLSRRGLENLRLKLFGRNYFDPQEKIEVPAYKVEVWPGYLTNIRQHENDTLMCVEIVGKVMRQETVYHILMECMRRNERDFQKLFKMEVLGTVVLTNYTDRTYQIDDVDFKASPSDTFEKEGQKISYAQYMKERYQVTVKNLKQPMLVSKANARQRRSGMPELIYLIPELCRTTGLTDKMRNDFTLMKEVGQHTCSEPSVRIQRLLAFNKRLLANQKTQDQWNQWGLSLGNEIVKVDGRVMQPEEVHFGGGAKETTSDWTRALQSMKPIVSQGKLDNWFILHPRSSRCIKDLLEMLQKTSKGMKFGIGRPQEVPLDNDNPATYSNMIENIMSKTTPQLIFCVVPNSQVPRYSTIKQKCCVDRPVPSQVIREQSITRRNALSIITNVVIQMNCKIGGVPWRVALPAGDVMVIGFDVCHDTAKDGYDYGAMVASINPDCTKYYSSVIPHKKGEEICDKLAEHIKDALGSYQRANGKYPRRIFMYRDGVGEGQIKDVYKVEVKKVLGMLNNFCGDHPVSLTYIVVTKRISTRFFKGRQNPDPGTLVDDVVTDPDKYDFFLVSAKATVGTITPTSYNIIHDDNRLKPEQLQRFTFKLTHLYFNTSKTVRVPAPCHYAHKLAFLVSQFIHRRPSDTLSELLYFL